MPAPTIKQITYRVNGPFGLSPEGELRTAYRIGHDANRALVFHPKDKDGSGSIEFCSVSNDSKKRLTPIYVSDPDLGENNYINLSAADEKYYRALVEAAGLKIPKTMALADQDLSKEDEPKRKPRRSPR